MAATEKTLSDVRAEMFLKDYELSIGIIQRHYDAIETLRKWELTLLPLLLGFASSTGLKDQLALLVVPVVSLFALLEGMSRANLAQVARWVEHSEYSLQEAEELEHLLKSHCYIITRDAQRSFYDRIKTTLRVLRSEEFLAWNGAVVVVLAILFLLL